MNARETTRALGEGERLQGVVKAQQDQLARVWAFLGALRMELETDAPPPACLVAERISGLLTHEQLHLPRHLTPTNQEAP